MSKERLFNHLVMALDFLISIVTHCLMLEQSRKQQSGMFRTWVLRRCRLLCFSFKVVHASPNDSLALAAWVRACFDKFKIQKQFGLWSSNLELIWMTWFYRKHSAFCLTILIFATEDCLGYLSSQEVGGALSRGVLMTVTPLALG